MITSTCSHHVLYLERESVSVADQPAQLYDGLHAGHCRLDVGVNQVLPVTKATHRSTSSTA